MENGTPLSLDDLSLSRQERSKSRESAGSESSADNAGDNPRGKNGKERRSKKLITRKSHRKSRMGCQNCKTRRIKCDEQKPQCSNCITRDISCDYLTAAAESLQSSSQAKDGLNVPDLELMYHWTASTCHSLSAWESGAAYWQINMTELMLKHTHSLRIVFALTALHLAQCRPSQKYQYMALADHHYRLGLPPLTKDLTEINRENFDAVYLSVQLVAYAGFARGPQTGEYLAFGESGRSDWLLMFRGIKTTIDTFGGELFAKSHNTRSAAAIAPLPADQVTPLPDWQARLAALRARAGTMADDPQHREEDLRAIEVLQKCYRGRYGGTDREFHVVFSWLYEMSDGFLERLQAHYPFPLILFAYFLVLLTDMERFWYMKGWPQHCMSGVYNALPEGERAWIRWPMGKVGWISPDTQG